MTEIKEAEILSTAAQQVLETMFFTSIMGDRETPPEEPAVDARTTFRGSPSGRFGLRLSCDAARVIAGNFLGAEDDGELTEAQIGEVVRELTNMICGAVLSQVESEAVFEIAEPELAAAEDAVVRCFDLDNGAIALSVSFDRS